MKFRIFRTSESYPKKTEDPQPCNEAFKEGDDWCININTLEEFIDFAKNNEDPLIIWYGTSYVYDTYGPAIEIYDDYRE